MAITFHCKFCGKKIEAPDNAGGKWGKCPSCHNKVYVADINANIDDLKLAPVDPGEEEKKRQLMIETFQLDQEILKEKDNKNPAGNNARLTAMSDEELNNKVIMYLRHMAEGSLDAADTVARQISPFGKRAVKILDNIALTDMPAAELQDIPSQVLAGLIRGLRNRIA
jgi:hypothetical protein